MDPLFDDPNLSIFLSAKLRAEVAIRTLQSEYITLQAHDNLYTPVKNKTHALNEGIGATMSARLGSDLTSTSQVYQRKIQDLRDLLDRNPKERDLQNALLDSGLLDVTASKVLQEVVVNPTNSRSGIRMDLVLDHDEDPTQIFELKRGSHLLVAREGKPTEALASKLSKKSLPQAEAYGRICSAAEIKGELEARHGVKIKGLELRLVAGRRLNSSGGYQLLSCAESHASSSGVELHIYTWDGLLAELERIVT